MYYVTRGNVPHKRHTQFRQPDGSLYHEELMGIHGFSGNKSLLYHLRPPTAVQRVEPGCEVKTSEAPQGPVRHRLLRTADIPAGGDPVQGRVPMMPLEETPIRGMPGVTGDHRNGPLDASIGRRSDPRSGRPPSRIRAESSSEGGRDGPDGR